jgi:hypothetical protein
LSKKALFSEVPCPNLGDAITKTVPEQVCANRHEFQNPVNDVQPSSYRPGFLQCTCKQLAVRRGAKEVIKWP